MSIKLNNGIEMPIVGFGLWKVNNDTCADQVYNAIKAGYRLLDGAVSWQSTRNPLRMFADMVTSVVCLLDLNGLSAC